MTHKEFIKKQEQEYQKLRNLGKTEDATSEYFGQIGSIPIEDIKYTDQIEIKEKLLNELFENKIPYELILEPSPLNKEYRFRMDYVCTNNPKFEPHNRMGQRKRGNFNWVIDMETCPLMNKEWFERVRNVYKKAIELGIPMYDVVSHKGNLRYLIIRASEDKAMLNVVVKESNPEVTELLEFAISQGFTAVYSIIQPEKGDHVDGELDQNLGEKYLEVNVSGKTLLVGPNSFFQNNIPAFEKIIDYIEEYISKTIKNNDDFTLLDLYCGVGTIGICLGEMFQNAFGIELVEESIEIAKQNAEINKQNINFLSAKVGVDSLPAEIGNNDNLITIVDPPRVGLEKAGIEAIQHINSKYLIYVSCNPVSQARDLVELLNLGYQVIDAKGFDLYPNTYHLENVLILERE